MFIVVGIAGTLMVFGGGLISYGLSQLERRAGEGIVLTVARLAATLPARNRGWILAQLGLGSFLVLYGLRLLAAVWSVRTMVIATMIALASGGFWLLWRLRIVVAVRRRVWPVMRAVLITLIVIGIILLLLLILIA